MFFWFIGTGILIFKSVFKDNKADLRYLVTGLLFLDLADAVLSIRYIDKEPRYITHSLIFSVLVMFVIMILSKRGTSKRKNLLLFSIGLYLHLFLDFMWLDQSTFLFPLPFESNEINVKTLSTNLILEIFGITYLIFKLKNFTSIKKFLSHGII